MCTRMMKMFLPILRMGIKISVYSMNYMFLRQMWNKENF